MAKKRMTWDWVGDYPIFVFTEFIDHGMFKVKVVKGVKGDQSAGDNSYTATSFIEYLEDKYQSKDLVVDEAFKKTAEKLGVVYEIIDSIVDTTTKKTYSISRPSMIQPSKPIPVDTSGTPPWTDGYVDTDDEFEGWFVSCDYSEAMKEILRIGWDGAVESLL